MKYSTLIAAAALAVGSVHAYAHDPNANTADSSATGDSTTMTSNFPSDPAPSVMPMKEGMDPVGKTRAEVIQELIRARQDGTLDRLNDLYYRGS